MSKQCCAGQTTVHWRSLRPRSVDGDDEKPRLTTGWSKTTLPGSFSSSLSRSQEWAEADVVVMMLSANILRACPTCKLALQTTYGVPSLWWSNYCQNANGYFGSAADETSNGGLAGQISWAKLRVKMVLDYDKYSWYKINVFVHWQPHHSTILLFDTPPSLAAQVPDQLFDGISRKTTYDPFWIYTHLLSEIVTLQDQMVWNFRTKIRTIEKSRALIGEAQPDFSELHDLARHSVHFLETFGLATKTINDILRDHAGLRISPPPGRANAPPVPGVRDQLSFFDNMLENLKHRATSNHQRLHNEIQLSFNLVTQRDAKVSLQLSGAMQADGAATKSLTLLASAFLPATFICAIFSMSFFSNEPETGWVVAGQIWIYFAFAVPVTVLTIALWRYGPALFVRKITGRS